MFYCSIFLHHNVERSNAGLCGLCLRKGPATKLRSVPMRLLSRRDCMEYTDRKMCVELCAIGEQEACAGFSGGPLIRVNRNKYTVVGDEKRKSTNYHSVPCNSFSIPHRLAFSRTVRPARTIAIRQWHS